MNQPGIQQEHDRRRGRFLKFGGISFVALLGCVITYASMMSQGADFMSILPFIIIADVAVLGFVVYALIQYKCPKCNAPTGISSSQPGNELTKELS